MIKKLRRKFILIVMSLISAVLLTVFIGIGVYYASSLQTEAYQALEAAIERPAEERGPKFQIGGQVPEGFEHDPMAILTVSKEGIVKLISAERIDIDTASLQDITQDILNTNQNRGELKAYDIRYVLNVKDGKIKIALMPLSLEHARLNKVLLTSGLGIIGAFFVILLASIFLSHWVLRPVEIAWKQQRQFVADASHELKTPLTVILANTGILKSHPEDTITKQMTWITNTEEEAKQMKGLVEDMLFLAKSDDTSMETIMQSFDLSEAINAAALTFEPLAFEQGRSLAVNIEPNISIIGNEEQIKQVMGILIDNAIKYSNSNSEINISLKKEQNEAKIMVSNMGPIISKDEMKHLFDRFYIADPSRTEKGNGLGLSIAQNIILKHKGHILAESDANNTRFQISLPIK